MSQFGHDVREGLTSKPKFLSSKYFYDKHGDELFRKIMELDEYYLTRAEFSIFRNQKKRIRELLTDNQPFRLIELGAGDGAKTMVLLEYFSRNIVDFTFCPIDISSNVLNILETRVRSQLPEVRIEPLAGDYFKILHDIKIENHQRNVVFFLGSNIGNFSQDLAVSFLKDVRKNLNSHDLMMIGFDLKKDPSIILNAYNDKKGVTR
ncbi:MAG: L-histidine N(alpha)-methyltransferase, partial [Cyclobacteriaceae bacterium]|nr:L-histidine N(alpha)-methyltransferase [Cyclobacteriaceae bacterium SS2]